MSQELINLMGKASVSLLLDSYDAIFSDFDPRPYTERTISDDFLLEAKRACREIKPGIMELHFLIPKHLRNPHEEVLIKERLHHHFKKYDNILKGESKKVVRHGMIIAIIGMLTMFLSSVVTHYAVESIFHDFLRVLLEPAGWFMAWYGLDEIFYLSRQQKPDLEFYNKMIHAEISFEAF